MKLDTITNNYTVEKGKVLFAFLISEYPWKSSAESCNVYSQFGFNNNLQKKLATGRAHALQIHYTASCRIKVGFNFQGFL